MADKPASILTGSQREYVRGENEPSNERVYKGRIRDRIESGLSDLSLLFREYDSNEIRETFSGYAPTVSTHDDAKGETPSSHHAKLWDTGVIAFLIEALNESGEQILPQLADEDIEQPALKEFRKSVESGVEFYLEDKSYYADVDVSIEINNIEHTEEFLNGLNESE